MKNSSCEQMWESSLWVPKYCSIPAITSFTAVGMLKNYGWLGRRGKKITVTFKYLDESQKHCEQRFSITTAAMREIQKWLGFIFKVHLMPSFFLRTCWHAEVQPVLSHSSGSITPPVCLTDSPQLLLIEITQLIFHSPSFSYFHSTFNSSGSSAEMKVESWVE